VFTVLQEVPVDPDGLPDASDGWMGDDEVADVDVPEP
jgi:hypothetical protein